MENFVRTFLKGPISDINHRFLLPTLSSDQQNINYVGPDFRQLVISLSHSSIQFQPNINLFYSLLILEPTFEQYSFGKFYVIIFIKIFNQIYFMNVLIISVYYLSN